MEAWITTEQHSFHLRKFGVFLRIGQHCEDHGHSYESTGGQTHLIKNGRKSYAIRQRGPTTWRDTHRRKVLNVAENWETKTSCSCIESSHLASMIIGSSKRNWKPCENCQTFALKSCGDAFILTRIGRPDLLWSVNKLARAVTKWTGACCRRLARLISYIHFTSEFRQKCHV